MKEIKKNRYKTWSRTHIVLGPSDERAAAVDTADDTAVYTEKESAFQ